MSRYVCLHGHFYQPPRENPWLGEIELQDSAAPFHDWNERIAFECYAPNAVARILDGDGRIVRLANNYSRISFNFGPTLLSWMERKFPDIYGLILEADRLSLDRFSGHGSAIAQVYNHVIMPLANRRDKETQVRWGVRDFEHRFGRPPEGMWLAETAVDLETLEVLAAHGIRFTILSPYQAGQVRRSRAGGWEDATGARIDTRVAYTQVLPSGREIALFFYDGRVSQEVAFGELLTRGEKLAEHLVSAFDGRGGPQLVHVATDGESYGHHRPHGDMALAYALEHIERRPDVRLTNYGEFLERHPPAAEVRITEDTAWSCSHGVGRWERDCGCHTGRGWHQRWRAPLRRALDGLRDSLVGPTAELGGRLCDDIWAVRDRYIECLLDPADENRARFADELSVGGWTGPERVRFWKLLELQHNALLMYTSCGWFFDDISGIETVQVLMYAGRMIQLAEDLFGRDLEGDFLRVLAEAPSNLAEYGDGRRIYERFVRPARIDRAKIAAHYAVNSLFEDYASVAEVFGYLIDRRAYHMFEAGRVRMALGRADLTCRLTGEANAFSFGAIHFGDHNVHCGVGEDPGDVAFEALLAEASGAFGRVDYPAIIRLMDRQFGESTYSLASLFRDERRKVLKRVLRESLAEADEAYAKIYQQHLPMMRFLSHLNTPLPQAYRTAAEFVFNAGFRAACAEEEPDVARLRELAAGAEEWDVTLEKAEHAHKFSRMLVRLADGWLGRPDDTSRLIRLDEAVALARELPFEVNFWDLQNRFFQAWRDAYPKMVRAAAVGWLSDFAGLGERLGIEVSQMKREVEELARRPGTAETVREMVENRHVPRATYRLQFHKGFTFDDALPILPYLAALGVSDVYASPILKARPGSMHGYDICDHGRINPELGGEEAFERFAAAMNEHGLKLILDTVPNHMGIDDPANDWWNDVLENGASARHAQFFDIDWDPVNPDLRDKILLPVLGEQYGSVLESGGFQLKFEEGGFSLSYFDHRFPVAPGTGRLILQRALEHVEAELGGEHEHVLELQSILTGLEYLPARTGLTPEKLDERYREKEILRRRTAKLAEESPQVHRAIERSVSTLNGHPGDPKSFDGMDELIDAQSYRPAFWRVAMEEINYRRFFDINDLAAIRVELPEVFRATHELFLRLIGEGKAHGLRIDHPDGLWNPTQYFDQLQRSAVAARMGDGTELLEEIGRALGELREPNGKPAWAVYVVAEKILSEKEDLPGTWAVAGTSGYDYLNQLNGLFVASENREAFDAIYRQFAAGPEHFEELVANCKKMIMLISMASEINSLSHQLDRIAERNRLYRDFTLNSLTFVIREVIAYLPVYRTYLSSPEDVTPNDRTLIERTVRKAKFRNPRTYQSVFDFLGETLLLKNLHRFAEEHRPMLIDWVMRFQQVSGPVMAKGVEDTAFYQYNRLVSLNEVGGHPDTFGHSVEEFHEANAARLGNWPQSMLGSSTHDTKRGEDVRARLNVLSELPEEWQSALFAWSQINAPKHSHIDEQIAPSFNDQYLLYQTLVGAWPVGDVTDETYAEFRERVTAYMHKATKEAKVRTSWVNPVAEYDQAITDFVANLLPETRDGDTFLEHFLPLQRKVAFFGYVNSLSQVVLKATSPGVPDFYQGNELWDFSLVDPDNRRPVDYGMRRRLLEGLNDVSPAELVAGIEDGRAKLHVTHQCLLFRSRSPELFRDGSYMPATASEGFGQHVCAFARDRGHAGLLAAVPLRVVRLASGELRMPMGTEVWKDGRLALPGGCAGRTYRNLFTGEKLTVSGGSPSVALAEVFASFPVALFEWENPTVG